MVRKSRRSCRRREKRRDSWDQHKTGTSQERGFDEGSKAGELSSRGNEREKEATNLKTRMNPSPFLIYISVKLVNCSIPCVSKESVRDQKEEGLKVSSSAKLTLPPRFPFMDGKNAQLCRGPRADTSLHLCLRVSSDLCSSEVEKVSCRRAKETRKSGDEHESSIWEGRIRARSAPSSTDLEEEARGRKLGSLLDHMSLKRVRNRVKEEHEAGQRAWVGAFG